MNVIAAVASNASMFRIKVSCRSRVGQSRGGLTRAGPPVQSNPSVRLALPTTALGKEDRRLGAGFADTCANRFRHAESALTRTSIRGDALYSAVLRPARA